MSFYGHDLTTWLFTGVSLTFLGLYVMGIVSGAEPEFALARAGVAGIALGALARIGLAVLAAAGHAREELDVPAHPPQESNARPEGTHALVERS